LFDTAYEELNQCDWNQYSGMYPIIEKYYDTIDYGKLIHEIMELNDNIFGTYDGFTSMLIRVMEESDSPKSTKWAMIHHYILMYCYNLTGSDDYKTQVLSKMVDVFFKFNEYDPYEDINKIVKDAKNYFVCEIREDCWEAYTLYELIIEKQDNLQDNLQDNREANPENNEPVDH